MKTSLTRCVIANAAPGMKQSRSNRRLSFTLKAVARHSGIASQSLAMTRKIYFSFAILFLISSCHKEKDPVQAPTAAGVYITNEGNYNFGNGEVSFYDPAKQTVTNKLFKAINNYSLGDVIESMYIKDSTAFIVVNNSSKIEVVKIPSLQHILTITIPNSSPRYFLPVSDSVAYITDLYAGKVHVINYLTGRLITNIPNFAQWTENLLMVNGRVVVEERSLSANPSSTGSVVTIDPATHTFLHRYSFSGGSTDGLVSDHLNRIWFGMDADSVHNVPASVYCLNNDMSLNKHIVLGAGHAVLNLKINGTGGEVYYLDNNGVNVISINDTVAPSSPLIPMDGRNLYGMGIDPVAGDIYVSDALDYVQPSRIYRYDKHANLLQTFTAGIISGNFAFSK